MNGPSRGNISISDGWPIRLKQFSHPHFTPSAAEDILFASSNPTSSLLSGELTNLLTSNQSITGSNQLRPSTVTIARILNIDHQYFNSISTRIPSFITSIAHQCNLKFADTCTDYSCKWDANYLCRDAGVLFGSYHRNVSPSLRYRPCLLAHESTCSVSINRRISSKRKNVLKNYNPFKLNASITSRIPINLFNKLIFKEHSHTKLLNLIIMNYYIIIIIII